MTNKYNDTLNFLYAQLPVFHQIGAQAYKPGLDNTIQLLNALKNPHRNYLTIHVGGTNGKGSVSHMLAAILQEAGYKTGLYTSPHLVDFGERIRVNGKMIAQEYVVDFVEENKSLFEKIQPSFFEATMAMAFSYFEYEKVDIAIIEVGLGGRLDSTNIIQPILSIITNISYDHQAFLGNTLEKIAGEKAGIIKMHTPIIIGEKHNETMPVFVQKATEMNAEVTFAEEKYRFYIFEQNNKYQVLTDGNKGVYSLDLKGKYQQKNLASVLCAIDIINNKNLLSKEIEVECVKNALHNVCASTGLQGRWQRLSEQPLVITDTGHNTAGIAEVVAQIGSEKYKHLHFVIGMANDKDVRKVLELLPKKAEYYFCKANIARAMDSLALWQQAQQFALGGNAYNTVAEAVEAALKNADKDDLVFIGGSNFVVGEAIPLF